MSNAVALSNVLESHAARCCIDVSPVALECRVDMHDVVDVVSKTTYVGARSGMEKGKDTTFD